MTKRRPMSKRTKAKIRATWRAKMAEGYVPEGPRGRPKRSTFSDEHRRKLSEARRLYWKVKKGLS